MPLFVMKITDHNHTSNLINKHSVFGYYDLRMRKSLGHNFICSENAVIKLEKRLVFMKQLQCLHVTLYWSSFSIFRHLSMFCFQYVLKVVAVVR